MTVLVAAQILTYAYVRLCSCLEPERESVVVLLKQDCTLQSPNTTAMASCTVALLTSRRHLILYLMLCCGVCGRILDIIKSLYAHDSAAV